MTTHQPAQPEGELLVQAHRVLNEYAERDSCIDNGNLYFAACAFRDELARLRKGWEVRGELLKHREAELAAIKTGLLGICQEVAKEREADFWSKVEKRADGCWEWKGNKDKLGYGNLRFLGRTFKAYRLAWTLINGKIPDGKNLCHKCNFSSCVNPDHLYPGTDQDNSRDARNAGRLAVGERCGSSKLTSEQVLEIYRSDLNYSILGAKYGVKRDAIERIKLGWTWSHITGAVRAEKKPRPHLRGERHGQAKLTAEQVQEIKEAPEGCNVLAKKYGVSSVTILNIRKGRTWTTPPQADSGEAK